MPVGVGARHGRAVVEGAAVAIFETPNDRELALHHVDAGHPLERLGDIARRVARQVLGAQDVEQLIRFEPELDRVHELAYGGRLHHKGLEVENLVRSLGRNWRERKVGAIDLARNDVEARHG